MRFLETQFNTWWKCWYSQYFSSLKKWDTKHRNLRVGWDVCWSLD